ncbi:MAG: ribonuclease Y, partial [Verrucomicrobia bacterium]|nr:ribonuclease Y [Verrucomicrobiota bacterium]
MRRFIFDNFEFLMMLQALIAVVIGYLGNRYINRQRISTAQREADRLITHARREADTIRREAEVAAKGEILAIREEFEKHQTDKRRELEELEKKLIAREASLQEKLETLIKREEELRESDLKLQERNKEADKLRAFAQVLVKQQQEELQRVASLPQEKARELVLKRVEEDMETETGAVVRRLTEQARDQAERESRRILSIAIQRYAAPHVSETTTTTVSLPSEDMKGRIIGREGRNIRAFEAATGVTPIIDDTPQVVVLSSFDPIRREVARISLEQLVADGRIHPARIEEVVQKAQSDLEETIRQLGEDACVRAGVHHVHPEIVKLLGRLKFRHSYAQNVLDHSVEVAHLVGAIAAELKLDVHIAKRVALLHDVGKAVNHEVEGSHAVIGADLLRRHGEAEEVVTGVASHHGEAEPNIYGILTSAGDAVSASRAGARSESAEIYLQRLEKLETIANSFTGVERSYAIQAGREIRVV